jgi:hypothetical protein
MPAGVSSGCWRPPPIEDPTEVVWEALIATCLNGRCPASQNAVSEELRADGTSMGLPYQVDTKCPSAAAGVSWVISGTGVEEASMAPPIRSWSAPYAATRWRASSRQPLIGG